MTASVNKRYVQAAVAAVVAAGVEVSRVEVDKDGKIVVIAGKPPDAPTMDAQDAGAVAKDRIAAMRREANE